MKMHLVKTIFLFVGCLIGTFAVQAQSTERTSAEQMPYFPGCTDYADNSEEKRDCSNQRLVNFLAEHLVYPEAAQKEGLEGTVYVGFEVAADGQVQNAKIIRDIGGGCGAAALDVINAMPRWEPARDAGEAVSVRLNLPVGFAFRTDKSADFQINWGRLTGTEVRKEQLESNIKRAVLVRDQDGNERPLVELIFAFEKGRRYYEEASSGRVNASLQKIIKKAKKGGVFTIIAVIQEEGERMNIERSFNVID